MRKRIAVQEEGPPSPNSVEEEDDVDDHEFDDAPPRNMSYVMERDVYSRYPGGHYASAQVSNGGGGSSVSSPREGSPEVTLRPMRFHISNNGYSGDDSKPRRVTIRYRECQKNHAASIGGHAVDGCGEFLPNGKEGTLEALTCAACSCHRNFHRREFIGPDGEYTCSCGAIARTQPFSGPYVVNSPLRPMSPGVREAKGHQLPSSADISPHGQMIMPISLAQYDDDDDCDDDDEPPPHRPAYSKKKQKRFRTKFTSEQKEKMLDFAESLGWRISKHDEEAVQEFCNDVGVKRNVFKVWMHNNKQHASGRKQIGAPEVERNCDSPPEY